MGVDPARSGDNLAIAIFRVQPDDNQIHLVRMITYHNTPFPEIHSEIRKLIKLYNIVEIGIDAEAGRQRVVALQVDGDPGTAVAGLYGLVYDRLQLLISALSLVVEGVGVIVLSRR